MEYLITENKELAQAGGDAFKEITCVVGQDYWIDGIQIVCIKAGNALAMDNIYLIDGPHSGDIPIFVDKNHDLSYSFILCKRQRLCGFIQLYPITWNFWI